MVLFISMNQLLTYGGKKFKFENGNKILKRLSIDVNKITLKGWGKWHEEWWNNNEYEKKGYFKVRFQWPNNFE